LVFLAGATSFASLIEEVLLCKVQSFTGNFVLRNENIFAFQLTANRYSFWKEGGRFKQVLDIHPGQMM
jgi:hypothetical protein